MRHGRAPRRRQPTLAEVDDLRALIDELEDQDRRYARIVALARRVKAAGTCEALEGLPLEQLLGFVGRRTYTDRRMILSSGELLESMPNVARLFYDDDALSYSQVRAIVGAVRDLPSDDRRRVDAAIAERFDALAETDPEDVVSLVDCAVAQVLPDALEREEQRAIEGSRLLIQPDLWGGSRWYAELDAELTATAVAAIDAAADPPVLDHRHADVADAVEGTCGIDGCRLPLDAERGPARPTPSRAQQRAEGLGRVCDAFLGGLSGRSRPRVVVVADDATLIDGRGVAELYSPLPGKPVWLSPETARRLACDARMVAVAVLPDGTVAVGNERDVVPKRIRTALHERDGRCRFPGCRAPARWTDAHHLRHRSQGGATVLSNLALLCRRCHTRVHRERWLLALHDDGRLTARRSERGRVYTSLPRRLRQVKLAPREPAPAAAA